MSKRLTVAGEMGKVTGDFAVHNCLHATCVQRSWHIYQVVDGQMPWLPVYFDNHGMVLNFGNSFMNNSDDENNIGGVPEVC